MSGLNAEQLKKLIREVLDFPKKGILFYDITTLLKDKTGFAQLIDLFSELCVGRQGLKPFARHGLQHDPRVPRQRPQFGVELAPQLVRSMVPRPPKVECNRLQSVHHVAIG